MRSIGYVAASPHPTTSTLLSTLPIPAQIPSNRRSDGRIEDCLNTLEPDRADAVRGAYLDGYSYDELAERYGVPLNTMRTWLRRSLLKLRECLGG